MTVSLAKRAASTMRKNAVAIKEEILRFVKANTDDYEVLAFATRSPPPRVTMGQRGGREWEGGGCTALVWLASLQRHPHGALGISLHSLCGSAVRQTSQNEILYFFFFLFSFFLSAD